MKRYWPILLLNILVFVISCKKEKEPFILEINSVLVDEAQKTGVAGAMVKLYAQELSTGVYNTSYTKKAESITDANGKIGIKFEQGDAVNYRLDISKEGYFYKSFGFNSKDIKPDQPYSKDILIMPESYIKVNIINSQPFNENDLLSFSAFVKKQDCDCCENISFNFRGMADTSYTCLLYGPAEYKIGWQVSRQNNNNQEYTLETIQTEALKTTVFDLKY